MKAIFIAKKGGNEGIPLSPLKMANEPNVCTPEEDYSQI